jgi:hypothetical protein
MCDYCERLTAPIADDLRAIVALPRATHESRTSPIARLALAEIEERLTVAARKHIPTRNARSRFFFWRRG